MRISRFLAVIAVLLTAMGWGGAARADDVLVFAAASTADALNDVGGLFAAKGLGTMRASYASSSTLARQIERGAPANVFLSADREWMDWLEHAGSVLPQTRRDLLGNALVLIAPANSGLGEIHIGRSTDIAALLGSGRLAVGDPDHVPVGIYAKQALKAMGQWDRIGPRLARAESVRAGMALVERGEAPLGIVYATDAALSKRVRVVGTFPAALHEPIDYPVALVAGRDTVSARAFLDFLQTPEAKAIFVRYGFVVH
ncbi:MAG: molybdate ABC transporter substrate-binding protein [Magnetospirillum sp.]|nr:molybdate ABC transporter substrate-binding protein [Magnetospirillum sp.]